MNKYLVLSPLHLNGKLHGPESVVEIDDAIAEPLLELGVVELSQESNKPKAPEGEERVAAIKAAIDGLDKANAELFTNAGVPKTDAIAAVTGWPVSAKERDEILAAAAE
jgi:hypothetical protein